MKFNIIYSDSQDLKEKKGALILSTKGENHILERHGAKSNIQGKTKFETNQQIYDLLGSTPYLEQIGNTHEYRGGNLEGTYNITAKKIHSNEFEVITMFSTPQKKACNNIR